MIQALGSEAAALLAGGQLARLSVGAGRGEARLGVEAADGLGCARRSVSLNQGVGCCRARAYLDLFVQVRLGSVLIVHESRLRILLALGARGLLSANAIY